MSELETLEREMHNLCDLRDQRIAAAEESIRRANIEFDRDAVPLGRKINALRVTAEVADKPTKTSKPKKQAARKEHDPTWSQEDIDHWYELQQREARNGQ